MLTLIAWSLAIVTTVVMLNLSSFYFVPRMPLLHNTVLEHAYFVQAVNILAREQKVF